MATAGFTNPSFSERSVMKRGTGRARFAADFGPSGTERRQSSDDAVPGILVIDKDPDVCAALVRWMKRQGVPVWAAHDEHEAAALYRNHRAAIGKVIDHLRLRCVLDAPFEARADISL
jgi:hypothetical protein